jgi:hypothetical protein
MSAGAASAMTRPSNQSFTRAPFEISENNIIKPIFFFEIYFTSWSLYGGNDVGDNSVWFLKQFNRKHFDRQESDI